MTDSEQAGARQNRQAARQQAMAERVMAEGSVRIEALADGFGISVMTVHRDLDDLEARGLLRKSRGVATAVSTSLVESSDVYRANREGREKEAIALAALDLIEPGQSIMLDDSTTAMHLVPHLAVKRPLTVITNTLTIMRRLNDVNGITLIGIGGQYYNWCSSFMGRQATTMIASMRADVCLLSTAAITDDIAFHQNLETIDVKRAMYDSSARRVLMADHTKFSRRAMHTLLPLTAFDDVLVDAALPAAEVRGLRERGVNVIPATRRRPTERV